MKPTPPKKRMTAKERVLAVYPKAYAHKGLIRYAIHTGPSGNLRWRCITDAFLTEVEAWDAAARSLP